MAIQQHSNATETQWNRGNLQVMIKAQGVDRPFGYCDGTPEDEQELITLAEREGLHQVSIQKKVLKTGREIWTVTGETI